MHAALTTCYQGRPTVGAEAETIRDATRNGENILQSSTKLDPYHIAGGVASQPWSGKQVLHPHSHIAVLAGNGDSGRVLLCHFRSKGRARQEGQPATQFPRIRYCRQQQATCIRTQPSYLECSLAGRTRFNISFGVSSVCRMEKESSGQVEENTGGGMPAAAEIVSSHARTAISYLIENALGAAADDLHPR